MRREGGYAIIKIITFLARRQDLPADAFHTAWRHARSAALPGLRGCVLNIPLEIHSRSDVALLDMDPIDGIEELWFDDSAAAEAMLAATRDAEAGYRGASRSFVTAEAWQVPMPPGPRPGVKSFTAIRRRDDATPEAFQHAWREVHGAMAATVPLLRGFVLSGIVAERPTPGPALRMALPLDGIAESWCADMDARRAMVVSPEAQHWFADGATFLGQVKTFLLRDEVLLAPPVSAAPRPVPAGR